MAEGDRSAQELAQTIRMLEEEIAILRRRLQDAPRRVRILEERLLVLPVGSSKSARVKIERKPGG